MYVKVYCRGGIQMSGPTFLISYQQTYLKNGKIYLSLNHLGSKHSPIYEFKGSSS